jgi:hypothetical protein
MSVTVMRDAARRVSAIAVRKRRKPLSGFAQAPPLPLLILTGLVCCPEKTNFHHRRSPTGQAVF